MKPQTNEPKDVNKYDLVFKIIDHPENYTDEQLKEILSDKEAREIYNLLSMTDSTVESQSPVNVEKEWDAFKCKHSQRYDRFGWIGSRAAAIIAFIMTSLAAVAIGVAITVAVKDRSEGTTIAESSSPLTEVINPAVENDEVLSDSIAITSEPVMFEDATLEEIVNAIASNYGMSVKCNDTETASLHLYYKFDPMLDIDDVISQLNTFDQIRLRRENSTIIIE